MGYLKTITGVTSGTVRLDRDAHTLLIVRHGQPSAYSGQFREDVPETVSSSIRNHSGQLEDIIKRCLLSDVVAYAQYGNAPQPTFFSGDVDGFNRMASALDFGSEGTPLVAVQQINFLPIALTADGKCVQVTAEDDFIFQFDGLIANAQYDFFALEGDQTGTNILRYETVNMLADQHERTLDVDAMLAIVMPTSTAITRLLLSYGNGRISKFSMRDIKFMSAQHNPIVRQTSIYTGSELAVASYGALTSDVIALPLHQITAMELDTDGTPLQFTAVYNRSRLAR
jgi:hypothetical protein